MAKIHHVAKSAWYVFMMPRCCRTLPPVAACRYVRADATQPFAPIARALSLAVAVLRASGGGLRELRLAADRSDRRTTVLARATPHRRLLRPWPRGRCARHAGPVGHLGQPQPGDCAGRQRSGDDRHRRAAPRAYPLTRQRVEWMLAPDGVGQFVSPGRATIRWKSSTGCMVCPRKSTTGLSSTTRWRRR